MIELRNGKDLICVNPAFVVSVTVNQEGRLATVQTVNGTIHVDRAYNRDALRQLMGWEEREPIIAGSIESKAALIERSVREWNASFPGESTPC